jgi:hypothetical protein
MLKKLCSIAAIAAGAMMMVQSVSAVTKPVEIEWDYENHKTQEIHVAMYGSARGTTQYSVEYTRGKDTTSTAHEIVAYVTPIQTSYTGQTYSSFLGSDDFFYSGLQNGKHSFSLRSVCQGCTTAQEKEVEEWIDQEVILPLSFESVSEPTQTSQSISPEYTSMRVGSIYIADAHVEEQEQFTTKFQVFFGQYKVLDQANWNYATGKVSARNIYTGKVYAPNGTYPMTTDVHATFTGLPAGTYEIKAEYLCAKEAYCGNLSASQTRTIVVHEKEDLSQGPNSISGFQPYKFEYNIYEKTVSFLLYDESEKKYVSPSVHALNAFEGRVIGVSSYGGTTQTVELKRGALTAGDSYQQFQLIGLPDKFWTYEKLRVEVICSNSSFCGYKTYHGVEKDLQKGNYTWYNHDLPLVTTPVVSDPTPQSASPVYQNISVGNVSVPSAVTAGEEIFVEFTMNANGAGIANGDLGAFNIEVYARTPSWEDYRPTTQQSYLNKVQAKFVAPASELGAHDVFIRVRCVDASICGQFNTQESRSVVVSAPATSSYQTPTTGGAVSPTPTTSNGRAVNTPENNTTNPTTNGKDLLVDVGEMKYFGEKKTRSGRTVYRYLASVYLINTGSEDITGRVFVGIRSEGSRLYRHRLFTAKGIASGEIIDRNMLILTLSKDATFEFKADSFDAIQESDENNTVITSL